MTHFFCLIIAGREIDSSTRIFKVGVGASRQCDRDFLFLLAKAVECNWYFEKWSAGVADFVRNIQQSLTPSTTDDPLGGLLVEQILIRDLVRCLKRQTAIPTDSRLLENANQVRSWLSLNYRTMTNRQGEAVSLPSVER